MFQDKQTAIRSACNEIFLTLKLSYNRLPSLLALTLSSYLLIFSSRDVTDTKRWTIEHN